MLSKKAVGNLINRYEAVLKKCRLINTFGSLAAAAMLVAGAYGSAMAQESRFDEHVPEYPDFVVGGVTDLGPPAESTHHLERQHTGVAWGVADEADTPALVQADRDHAEAVNDGYGG